MSITQKEADALRCLINKRVESALKNHETRNEAYKIEEDLRLLIENLKEK